MSNKHCAKNCAEKMEFSVTNEAPNGNACTKSIEKHKNC